MLKADDMEAWDRDVMSEHFLAGVDAQSPTGHNHGTIKSA